MSIKEKIRENISLKEFNTFRVGGEVKYYLEVKSKDDLMDGFQFAQENELKTYILGGGSNIVTPDSGINGLVLHISNDEKQAKGDRLDLGAGVSLAQAASLALNSSLSGLEWSSGIPRATVGGAIRGNAGAFGTCMQDIVETVEIYNSKRNEFETLSKNMCLFSYRSSIFKQKPQFLVWKTILKLEHKEKNEIEEKMEESLEFRKTKYPQLPSAGSVFTNIDPEIAKQANPILFNREFKDKIGREGWLSAGLIIEKAGLKGKSMGGIKISLEHANHIVNTGKGTSEEIIMMISYIKQQVRNKFGIQLVEEVTYFGF